MVTYFLEGFLLITTPLQSELNLTFQVQPIALRTETAHHRTHFIFHNPG